MKMKIIVLIVMTVTLVVIKSGAFALSFFSGWDRVIGRSPDVLVVTCGKPTPPTPNVDVSGPKSDYQVEVVSVLKGTNTVASARLLTEHELETFHTYLVFGDYYNTNWFDAFEDYRVIELDKSFRLDSLSGKTFDQKLQILFQSGVDCMNKKIQQDENEKDRLQQALQQ